MGKIINFNDFVEGKSAGRYLPSYEDCQQMVAENPGVFYEATTSVDGYPISMFNYRHAQYINFTNPIESRPEVDAFEMRGITFVFNKDGSVAWRVLLLDKFFNLNQVPGTMYSVVKDWKVKNIMNKEDGSVASFIRLPSGRTVGRSKMSFEISDQSIAINRLYETNKTINIFVDTMMNMDYVPIFEYVAPNNRIVLKYKNEDLILLRVRNNKTGEYVDLNDIKHLLDGINVANFENEHTLDGLIELMKVQVDKEGVIVMFENGKMIKLKTEWYFDRHGLMTTLLERETDIIKLIITDQIDDVLAQLEEGDEDKREMIQSITDVINNYIGKISGQINAKMIEWKEIEKVHGDNAKKVFSLNNNRDKLFSFYMSAIKGEDVEKIISDRILKNTSHLLQARKWLEQNK